MGNRKGPKTAKASAPAAPADSDRRRLPSRFVLAGAFIVLLLGAGIGAFLLFGRGSDSSGAPTGLKTAVIVDQLSLTQPNPDFAASARKILAEAGYLTDYFPGEQVTVDFYRTLPDRGYDLILMRVHAGITTEVDASSGDRIETEYVSLFTGEPYQTGKYPDEQLNRLGRARYTEHSPALFGIGPDFITHSMEGDFNGALIVMMGCDGLRSQRTAEAFLEKGASAFVSWSQPVSAAHTDAATQRLLERLFLEQLPAAQAVRQTADEVGPDPYYDGELRILEAES